MIVTLPEGDSDSATSRPRAGRIPPFPFPPPGESRGGRVPPTPEHAARQPKPLARIMRRLPPQEGLPPPCASPARATRRIGPGREAERIDSRLQRKGPQEPFTQNT